MEQLKNLPPGINADKLLADYGELTAAYEAKWGTVPAVVRQTIGNIVRLQLQIDLLMEEAERKGVMETVRNGRQTFARPRKSTETAAKLMRECTRLRDTLKLAPHNPRGAERIPDDDDAEPEAATDEAFDDL